MESETFTVITMLPVTWTQFWLSPKLKDVDVKTGLDVSQLRGGEFIFEFDTFREQKRNQCEAAISTFSFELEENLINFMTKNVKFGTKVVIQVWPQLHDCAVRVLFSICAQRLGALVRRFLVQNLLVFRVENMLRIDNDDDLIVLLVGGTLQTRTVEFSFEWHSDVKRYLICLLRYRPLFLNGIARIRFPCVAFFFSFNESGSRFRAFGERSAYVRA